MESRAGSFLYKINTFLALIQSNSIRHIYMGKGFIVTNSEGVKDYVIDDYNAVSSPPASDFISLREKILALWLDYDKCIGNPPEK